MIRKYIPIIFILSFLVSQSIIHNPRNTLEPGRSFEVEASVIGLIHSQSDVTVTDQETASKLRARSSRLEDEKLQSYQQRYEEYVSVGKALTDLQKTDR